MKAAFRIVDTDMVRRIFLDLIEEMVDDGASLDKRDGARMMKNRLIDVITGRRDLEDE